MQRGVCVCVCVGFLSLKKIFEGVISILTYRTWLFWWGSIVWMVLEFSCELSNMIYFIWEFFINKHHINPLKLVCVTYRMGSPGGSVVKNLLQCRRHGFHPWVYKIPWRRKWQPTPVFLPEKSHEQRSQEGYSPWGLERVSYDLATKQQQHIGWN